MAYIPNYDDIHNQAMNWYGMSNLPSLPDMRNYWNDEWAGMQGRYDDIGSTYGLIAQGMQRRWGDAYKNAGSIAPALAGYQGYTASQHEVGPDQLTQNQLTELIDKDSKYLRQARRNAAETANARGLLNSSLAAGAGEQAAISAALPIASEDAGRLYDANSRNVAYQNDAKRFLKDAYNQNQQFNAGVQNDIAKYNQAAKLDALKGMTDFSTTKFANRMALAGAQNQLDQNMVNLISGGLMDIIGMNSDLVRHFSTLEGDAYMKALGYQLQDDQFSDQLLSQWYEMALNQGLYGDGATEEQRRAFWRQFQDFFGDRFQFQFTPGNTAAAEGRAFGRL